MQLVNLLPEILQQTREWSETSGHETIDCGTDYLFFWSQLSCAQWINRLSPIKSTARVGPSRAFSFTEHDHTALLPVSPKSCDVVYTHRGLFQGAVVSS